MKGRRLVAILLVGLSWLSCAAIAQAQAASAQAASRGELLYSVHCIACHSTQMHWREKKLAVDWKSLQVQVQRWQAFSELGWSKEDVAEVARYLNRLYYHYPDASSAD